MVIHSSSDEHFTGTNTTLKSDEIFKKIKCCKSKFSIHLSPAFIAEISKDSGNPSTYRKISTQSIQRKRTPQIDEI
jgi:hypothetical protein